MSEALLTLRAVHKAYGPTRALAGVDFDVRAGEVHALLGQNGSGKSTLMKIAFGEVAADAGEVAVAGTVRHFRSPHDAIAAGIAMVPQEIPSALDLTVAENVLLGALPTRRGSVNWPRARELAAAALAQLGADIDLRVTVRTLPPHDRQVVAIAHALAAGSRVLIFDEPTSSLSLADADRLLKVMRQLRSRGIGVVMITQRLREVAEVADRVTVLRDGVIAGVREGRTSSQEVADLVTGTRFAPTTPPPFTGGATPALQVSGLADGAAVHGVDLEVGAGEIVGISGLLGCGRSELLRLLFGAGVRPVAGTIAVAGRELGRLDPPTAIRHGIALVTADRRHEGLVLGRSIHENLMLIRTRRLSLRRLRYSAERRTTQRIVDDLRIKIGGLDAAVGTLSGGNQQKVVLGKWLVSDPRVLLLDEPTRGIDVSAKADFYRAITAMAASGVGVLVGSLDDTELLEVCHRIVVMRDGRVAANLDAARTSESELLLCASGTETTAA